MIFFGFYFFNVWTGRQVQAGETQTKRSSMSRSCSRSLESTRYPIQSTYNVGRYTKHKSERRWEEKKKWHEEQQQQKKGNKRQNRISSSSNFLWNTTEREDRTNCVCVRIFSCYVALLLSFHIISNHPYVALIIALPPRSFKKSSSSFDCVCLLWNCGKSWKLWFSYPYFGFGLISTPALPSLYSIFFILLGEISYSEVQCVVDVTRVESTRYVYADALWPGTMEFAWARIPMWNHWGIYPCFIV